MQGSADQIEQRSFAAAVRTDNGNEIAVFHFKIKAVKNSGFIHRAGIKTLRYITEFKHAFPSFSLFCPFG